MATFTNAFDSYQIFYYGGTLPSNIIAAVVQCYQGQMFVGRIAFYPTTPASVPANITIAPVGTAVPSIHYALSSFQDVVGVLRHAKPLYLFLDTASGLGMLATSQTLPVGEEEGN